MNFVDILSQHKTLERVEIDTAKNAKDFWKKLANDAYNIHNVYSIYDWMLMFQGHDSLEIVNRQGRLLRRFNAYYKANTMQSLTDAQAGIIGDKLQYYLSKSTTYFVDFTNEIDWCDGQFGKDDSCWWSCYIDSISTYEQNGGWAIRFYADENQNNYNGIGRTWVMPKDRMLVCFNSYGIERPVVSKVIKAIFAKHDIELHYQTVSISNKESETIPYINDGSGFVLSESEESLEDIVFSMPIARMRVCGNCNTMLRKTSVEIRGYHYCENCVKKHFKTCDICNILSQEYSVHPFEGKNVCEDCLKNANAKRCGHCNQYSRTTVTTHEQEVRCENCRVFECQKCKRTYAYRDTCPCEAFEETYKMIRPLFAKKVINYHFFGIHRRRRVAYEYTNQPHMRIVRSESRWWVFYDGFTLGRYSSRDEAMRMTYLLHKQEPSIAEPSYYSMRRIERDNQW